MKLVYFGTKLQWKKVAVKERMNPRRFHLTIIIILSCPHENQQGKERACFSVQRIFRIFILYILCPQLAPCYLGARSPVDT